MTQPAPTTATTAATRAAAIKAAPAAMPDIVRDIWYLAGLSKDFRAGKMEPREIAGEPIVMGRSGDGEVFALRDMCAHRAAPLSAGRIVQNGAGATLECPYHGWRFRTGDGVCAHIPSLVEGQQFDVEKIRVRRYPLHEADGVVWIFIPANKHFQGEPDVPPPSLPVKAPSAPRLVERAMFECTHENAVIGLIDPAHGPYVHRQWWWRTGASMHEKKKSYVPSEHGFTMVAHKPSSNSFGYKLIGCAPTTEISFRLQGVRYETIQNEKTTIIGMTALTPVNAEETLITHVMWWDTLVLTLLKPIIMQNAARTFLGQDGRIVALQHTNMKHDPGMLLVDDADTLCKWYLKMKKEWTASRAEKRPFKNPVEPTTLRWRT